MPKSLMLCSRWRLCLFLQVAVLLFLFTPERAHGIIFSWPASGWTAGAPGPGATATQSFTSVAPNDITVSINNNGVAASGAAWQPGYPAINSTNETGGLSGTNALQLFVTAQSSTSAFIKTTVMFANPVTSVSFQIWDVDKAAGQFADQISLIQALAVGGATVGPTSVTSAVPGFNTITGTGLSTVVLGTAGASNTTNQGTIDISFTGPITQFSFEWFNKDGGLGQQAIALGPISYLPEISPGWITALVCVAAVGAREVSRRRKLRAA
jgi:hypothetical protein